MAEHMARSMNRSIVVNNRPGGGTNIAADYVARSKAYGNIVFTGDFATLAANPYLYSKLDASTIVPQIKTGKLKVLGVATSQRLKNLPDVPTLSEQGLTGFEAFAWQGLLVPTGTPKDVIDTLAKALSSAIKSPEVIQSLEGISVEPWFSTPTQMGDFVAKENERWGKLIRDMKLTLE